MIALKEREQRAAAQSRAKQLLQAVWERRMGAQPPALLFSDARQPSRLVARPSTRVRQA